MTQIYPELLAPAGNWECARAAVANGADAIYFGLPLFNARMRADNFTLEELPRLVDFLHTHQVKAYVTLNTLIFTSELPAAEEFLLLLQQAGVDAVIVQDLGLVRLAREVAPDVSVHASTQMTITSPEGASWAKKLGASRVVLARETSMREMERFDNPELPSTEVFVHGALCVAYSGQCLTSESLGQRSANRGECAQACRLPYQLVVDGALKDLGNQRYLLSPQDLAAVEEIPQLIKLGVTCFKIEGRLKAREYVAAVCQVYRKAIDAAMDETRDKLNSKDLYKLEMTFSRGLFSGWMHGVNHQKLVHGLYSNKRGPLVGQIAALGRDHVVIDEAHVPLKAGDGLLFDDGGNQDDQQGGRIYGIQGNKLYFQHGKIHFNELRPGMSIYKTNDPHLDSELKKSIERPLEEPRITLNFCVEGKLHEKLSIQGEALGEKVSVSSEMDLAVAQRQPLTNQVLQDQLERLGESCFALGEIDNRLTSPLIVPLKELNRMRRVIVETLYSRLRLRDKKVSRPGKRALDELLGEVWQPLKCGKKGIDRYEPLLIPLCRSMAQLETMLGEKLEKVYVDFEDIRRYAEAVKLTRDSGPTTIYLATPRIQKASELGLFKLIEAAEPDGVLLRNLGSIEYFQQTKLQCVGDFSLNVANPLAAHVLMEHGLERVTVSYDLNVDQVKALLRGCPDGWFEIVLHQHMPMFHMEHCVFAAFLSKGTDFLTCGRPCDRHDLRLRDRVGMDHPVMADVGCRNTVFHGKAQTGASYLPEFFKSAVKVFRLELLRETSEQSLTVYRAYRSLLDGTMDAAQLIKELKVVNQLGVTNGTLTVL